MFKAEHPRNFFSCAALLNKDEYCQKKKERLIAEQWLNQYQMMLRVLNWFSGIKISHDLNENKTFGV